jgi:hypothetical protein
VANYWELELCVALVKKKNQHLDGKRLKEIRIDVRKFRLDTVYRLNVELKDRPPLKDRHYVRSVATVSILIT